MEASFLCSQNLQFSKWNWLPCSMSCTHRQTNFVATHFNESCKTEFMHYVNPGALDQSPCFAWMHVKETTFQNLVKYQPVICWVRCSDAYWLSARENINFCQQKKPNKSPNLYSPMNPWERTSIHWKETCRVAVKQQLITLITWTLPTVLRFNSGIWQKAWFDYIICHLELINSSQNIHQPTLLNNLTEKSIQIHVHLCVSGSPQTVLLRSGCQHTHQNHLTQWHNGNPPAPGFCSSDLSLWFVLLYLQVVLSHWCLYSPLEETVTTILAHRLPHPILLLHSICQIKLSWFWHWGKNII